VLTIINNLSVKINKKRQIELRRQRVLELHSQGLTQEQIAAQIVAVSQPTISGDLAYLEKESINLLKNSSTQIALEYRTVLSNLYQLRRDAWVEYNRPDIDLDSKLALTHTIERLSIGIFNMLASSDLIQLELLENEKQRIQDVQDDLETVRKVRDDVNSTVF